MEEHFFQSVGLEFKEILRQQACRRRLHMPSSVATFPVPESDGYLSHVMHLAKEMTHAAVNAMILNMSLHERQT
jgi:hypothetical protein